MSKILIIAATHIEIAPLLAYYGVQTSGKEGFYVSEKENKLAFLITGVGMINTAFYSGKYINDSYHIVLNLGITGAFNRKLQIGEVVNVTEDVVSELGAQDGDNFILYSDLNLGGTNRYVSREKLNSTLLKKLSVVKGITVNTIHGNENSIQEVVKLFSPDVESMEGAAFLRACTEVNGNAIQIRSVSNYVERRNKNNWNIPLAIKNLNDFAIAFIEEQLRA